MPKFCSFLFYLEAALDSIPNIKVGVVYCGIPSCTPGDYEPIAQIFWREYSLASMNILVAKKFAKEHGFIFLIRKPKGKHISPYSFYDKEQEVLLSPNIQ
jgi:hypothetical protein